MFNFWVFLLSQKSSVLIIDIDLLFKKKTITLLHVRTFVANSIHKRFYEK